MEYRDKTNTHKRKNLNNVLNQNVYTIKRVRLSTFIISIVDNLYFLYQNKWNTIKIRWPGLTTNAPKGSNFATIPDFLAAAEKTGRCREVILAVGDVV